MTKRLMWLPVTIAPQYEVSENGTVRRAIPAKNSPAGRVLSVCYHEYGYPRVPLTINGQRVRTEVHKLVALAFLGPKPFEKAEVCHLDGNPRNNHFANLKWASHQENEAHKFLHGTTPRGERNGCAKLKEDDIRLIRKIRHRHSLSQLGKMFGVEPRAISKICRNERWTHVI